MDAPRRGHRTGGIRPRRCRRDHLRIIPRAPWSHRKLRPADVEGQRATRVAEMELRLLVVAVSGVWPGRRRDEWERGCG
jgi:hypothetical protein